MKATFTLVISGLLAGAAFGQERLLLLAGDPATQARPRGAAVFKVTVQPAATGEPALRYQLLPPYLDQTPGDAMTLYYMATEMIPREDASRLRDKIADWVARPLAALPLEEARNAVMGHRTCLRQLELAARREQCHWDLLVRSEGIINLVLPPLGKYRELARALALRIRLAIAEKDYDQAVKDLQTGYAMARDVAEGPTLINALVGVAIANLMTAQVQELIQAPGAPNLYWALTDLPSPLIDTRRAMQVERNGLYLSYPRLRDLTQAKLTPHQWRAVQDEMGQALTLAATGAPGPQGRGQMVLAGLKYYSAGKKYLIDKGVPAREVEAMPVAQVLALYGLETYEKVRDEVFKWDALPYWQAEAGRRQALARIEKARKESPGLFLDLIPTLGRAQLLCAIADRRIAALRVIEAVRHYAAAHEGKPPPAAWFESLRGEGPPVEAMLPLPTDPVSGKPFRYTAQGQSFVLQTDLLPDMGPRDTDRYEVTILP